MQEIIYMNKFSNCKSCGGKLERISEDTLRCTYCRSTFPVGDDEEESVPESISMQLSQAGNYMKLRRYNDAAETYRVIQKAYPDEIRAYWGEVLAEYGIEYVEDKDGSAYPTINRLSRYSVMNNRTLGKMLGMCDIVKRERYKAQASELERVRMQSYEVSQRQEDFDVFICYGSDLGEKSTAELIKKTLEAKGCKVYTPKSKTELQKGISPDAFNLPAIESSEVMFVIADSIASLEQTENIWRRFLDIPGKSLQVIHGGLNENEFPPLLRMAFQRREPISTQSRDWLKTCEAFAVREEKKNENTGAGAIDKAYVDEALRNYQGGFATEAKNLTEAFVMALSCMTAGNTFEAERVVNVQLVRFKPEELKLISELCLELAKMSRATPAERQACIQSVGNISAALRRGFPALTVKERQVYSEIGNAKLLVYLAKCFGAIRDYKRQGFVLDLVNYSQLYDPKIINELVNMMFTNNRSDNVAEILRAVSAIDGDNLLLSFLKNFRGEQKLTLLMGITDKVKCSDKIEDELNGYLSGCEDTGVALAVVSIMSQNKLKLSALGLSGALSNVSDVYGVKTVLGNFGKDPIDGITVDNLVAIAVNGGVEVAKEVLKYLRYSADIANIGAHNMQRLIHNCKLNAIKNELFAFNIDKKLAETLLIQTIKGNGADRLDNIKVLSEYVPAIEASAYESLLLGNDPLKVEFMRILAPKTGRFASANTTIEKYLLSRDDEYTKREIFELYNDFPFSDRALELYLSLLPSAYGEIYIGHLKTFLTRNPAKAREMFVKHYEALVNGYEKVLPLIAGYLRTMPEDAVVRFVCEFKGNGRVKDKLLITLMQFIAKPKNVEVKYDGVECNLLQAYLLTMSGQGDGTSEAVAYLRKCGLKADDKIIYNGKKTKFRDYLDECALSSAVKNEISRAIK